MSGPLQNSMNFLPWVSFIAGFGGSLHCLGMCGGLVTATCHKSQDVLKYQLGRLAGYLLLGFFAGVLGQIFLLQLQSPLLTFIPGIFIGGLFLFWGIQSFLGKRAELPTPKFLKSSYQFLWGKWIANKKSDYRSIMIGFLSILLPCGLLYGVVLGLVAFEHSFKALYGMFFFWLGTVPSMVLAPSIVTKILKPIKEKLPKIFGIALMLLGVTTISARVYLFEKKNLSETAAPEAAIEKPIKPNPEKMHCH